ncbi:MAG: hypothetical protein IV089_03555, partial [Thiobacillus sp.]|nr:hypothetical protein [Thiobacillus sp.]
MGDLVMAWARDRTTEDPRYIGELGEHQRGANCNCECISCGLPLVAVNAAKTTFKIRPHFRHPEGAEKSSCLILAARAAALATLKSTGILELPRRRQSARVAGLSGEYYDAWVETPPEQVRVHDFKFHDRVSGILTLEDGRQLKVELIGSVGPDTSSETGALIPTILMSVEDPHIAGMPPEELIKRLRLIVDNASWCSHWNDEALALEADEAAREMAVDALDWLGDDVSFPDAVDGDVKRETLLHLKAKEILEREKRIFLPDLSIEVEAKLLNGELLYKQDVVPGQMVQLESVILEKNLGRIKPDVMANTIEAPAWPAGTILIEVTVTNTISEERIERIKAVNIPTIEIDISKMGGRFTEAEFERLVIEELAGKRWLHHPRMAQEEIRLRRELTIEVNIANTIELGRLDLERKHKEIKSVSVDKWAHQYLHSVQSHAEARVQVEVSGGDPQGREDALERIYECAAGLSAYGFQEAQDKALFWQRGNILERILSLKQNKASGYKLDTAWQVINSILQERPPHSKWQTLYLIATKVYKPTLNTQQAERVADWRNEVWRSLGHGEQTYQRSREYDNLLALLFPELAEALAQSLTRKMYSANRQPSIASATQNRLAGQNGYVQFGYRNSRVSISVSDCDEWM